MKKWLNFEQPIAELEAKIDELKLLANKRQELNLNEEIDRLKDKSKNVTNDIFKKLTPWNVLQVARHPNRPQSSQYVTLMGEDFLKLRGDQCFTDDPSILGGLLRMDGITFMFVAHQKGMTTKDKIRCNFGMTQPQGYKKAYRLFKMAEQLKLPVLTMVDTPGAYPGVQAEKNNQSEAIAKNLELLSALKTPVITVVTGEGGSGGALALSVADHLVMLQNSVYSVISPEGCASILWKDAAMAQQAAAIMKMTAQDLYKNGLIDHVLPEPIGGAHRDIKSISNSIKKYVVDYTRYLLKIPMDQLLEKRYERLMQLSKYEEDTTKNS